MSAGLTVVIVAAMAFVAIMTWLALPYVRQKSDHRARLDALEAATVSLSDRASRVEQMFEAGPRGVRGLPGAMSR